MGSNRTKSGWGVATATSILSAVLFVGIIFVLILMQGQVSQAEDKTAIAMVELDSTKSEAQGLQSKISELQDLIDNERTKQEKLQQDISRLTTEAQKRRAEAQAQRDAATASQAKLEAERRRHIDVVGMDMGMLSDFLDENQAVKIELHWLDPDGEIQLAYPAINEKMIQGIAKSTFDRIDLLNLQWNLENPEFTLAVYLQPQFITPSSRDRWWTCAYYELRGRCRIPGTDKFSNILLDANFTIFPVEYSNSGRAYRSIKETFGRLSESLERNLRFDPYSPPDEPASPE